MNVRLVLAGLVASLGVSVPSWPEIEGAFRLFQDWGVARLADWEARSGARADFIRAPEWTGPADERLSTGTAVSQAARGTGPIESPMSFEPIAVSERADDLATVLNRMADGQEDRLAATKAATGSVSAPRRDVGRSGDPGQEEARPFSLERQAARGPMERSMGLELARAVQQSRADRAAAGPRGPVPGCSLVARPAIANGPDETAVGPEAHRPAFGPSSAPIADAMLVLPDIPEDPWAPADVPAVVATADAPSPSALLALPEIPEDPWAPSNAASVDLKGRPATATATIDDERLARALDLTRAAARAWMSALAAPLEVRMTAR